MESLGGQSLSNTRVHPMAVCHNGEVWAELRDTSITANTNGSRNIISSPPSQPNSSVITCESLSFGSCEQPAMASVDKPGEWDSPQRSRDAATPSEVEARTDVQVDLSHLDNNQTKVKQRKQGPKKRNAEYTRLSRSAPIERLEHPADKSLFVSFLSSLFFLVVSLVLLGPMLVIFIVFLPIGWLIKRCMACCCCCAEHTTCACCCSKMLNQRDEVWLHDSPFNKMVAQSLCTLRNGLDIIRIRDLVNSRLISAEGKNGHKLYPRFSQKLIPLHSGHAWVHDSQFSINNHIYLMPKTISNQLELEEHIGEMAGKALSSDRPLWEMQILSDFGDDQDTVILFRIHPCVSDGISLMRILYKSLVDNQDTFHPKSRFGRGAYVFNVIRAIFVGPLVFLKRWIFTSRDHNILHGPGLSGNKVVAWSEPFSMDRALRIKQVTRSTLNDVLVAVVAGNLRAYLQKCGITNPFDLKINIPIDFQTDGPSTKMGAKYTMVSLSLPTNTEGAIPQLWAVKHRMDELKNSADPVILYGIQWMFSNLLPHRLFQCMWTKLINKATCVVCNLPGPEGIFVFASREVKSMMFWMPPQHDVPVSISFFSYADQLRMTVIADKAVLPDPHFITKDFIAQLENFSQLLANRRIPGEHHSRHIDLSAHDDGLGGNEPTMEEIKIRLTQVQLQLQDLKSRLDMDSQEEYSHEERALMNKVEELKEEFRELLAELRRKKAGDGTLLSDDEEDEDGELRRAYRKHSMSSTSRRSLVSISASTTRSLNTSPLTSQHNASPPLSRAHHGSQHVSTPSSPSMPENSDMMVSAEEKKHVVNHEGSAQNKPTNGNYSPSVEKKQSVTD